MKTIAVLSIVVALLVAAAAAHADVIITTYTNTNACDDDKPSIVQVAELSCRVDGSASAKYESNSTHVEAKTYTGTTCAGVPTINYYQKDVCYPLSSSDSVKYGTSDTPVPATSQTPSPTGSPQTPAPASAGFVSTTLVAIIMVFVAGAMIVA